MFTTLDCMMTGVWSSPLLGTEVRIALAVALAALFLTKMITTINPMITAARTPATAPRIVDV